MSPESRNKARDGRHSIGHDFFGLGVMMFVMFTCQYPFSKLGNFNTVIQAHLSDMSLTQEVAPTAPKPFASPKTPKMNIQSYNEGSDLARNSTAMREMALIMEAKHLPAHYVMDEHTLSKLPSESARDIVKALLLMNEKYRLGAKGARQVMKHPFFLTIDWNALRNKTLKAPAKPDTTRASVATGELDLMKLLGTTEGAEAGEQRPKLSPEQQAMFSGFMYNPYTDEAKARRKAREEAFALAQTSAKVGIEPDYTSDSSLRRESKNASFMESYVITEEKIDSRTGLAITSENLHLLEDTKKRQDEEEQRTSS